MPGVRGGGAGACSLDTLGSATWAWRAQEHGQGRGVGGYTGVLEGGRAGPSAQGRLGHRILGLRLGCRQGPTRTVHPCFWLDRLFPEPSRKAAMETGRKEVPGAGRVPGLGTALLSPPQHPQRGDRRLPAQGAARPGAVHPQRRRQVSGCASRPRPGSVRGREGCARVGGPSQQPLPASPSLVHQPHPDSIPRAAPGAASGLRPALPRTSTPAQDNAHSPHSRIHSVTQEGPTCPARGAASLVALLSCERRGRSPRAASRNLPGVCHSAGVSWRRPRLRGRETCPGSHSCCREACAASVLSPSPR